MNTPAHVIINLAILGPKSKWKHSQAVFWGSMVPDIPMFIFYVVEKILLGTSEMTIWRVQYFDSRWQMFFDTFNSFPVIAFSIIVTWKYGMEKLRWFFSGMLLHTMMDFPLHNEDAHGHFFPFSDYHFRSPISYWNSQYYGNIISKVEILMTLVLAVYCFKRVKSRGMRWLILGTVGFYIFMIGTFFIWFGAVNHSM